MAMRKKYVRYPEFLAEDIEAERQSQRYFHDFIEKLRKKYGKKRVRTRMIGKRELTAHGIHDEAKIGEYLSLPENQHRRVSGKTAYKVCRKWLKK